MPKNKPTLASLHTCTGCLACVDSCPKNAISDYVGEDGHIYVKVNETSCIGCLKCQRICNSIHARSYSNNEKTSQPYSAFTNLESDYKLATSGGVFPAIARYILSKGGVVYGAAYTDGFHMAHIGVESETDLYKLQGSKYVQSNLKGIYKAIESNLKDERIVLFSGTGCQVAAVLAYFENNKNKSLLHTMDLVCGGVPSSLLIDSFVKNAKPQPASIAYFRDKEKYRFAYYADGDKLVKCGKSLPLDGFKSSLTNRFSCYNCQFTGIHRSSDWTIGDLWGDKDNSRCKSLCICHNERAVDILKSVDATIEKLTDWRFVQSNPRLVNGRCKFENRFERRHIGWLFKHLSYRSLCKMYAADVKKYDVLWMIYKVYRYYRFMNYFKGSKAKVMKIIQ